MSTDTPGGPTPDIEQSELSAAEVKRLNARRRFLRRTSTAASGVLVVTLVHQRGVSAQTALKFVSSPEACLSLGGTPRRATAADGTDSLGRTDRYVCQNLPVQLNPANPNKKPKGP